MAVQLRKLPLDKAAKVFPSAARWMCPSTVLRCESSNLAIVLKLNCKDFRLVL